MATLNHKKQSNRLVIAGALFFTSIFASAAIAYLSQTGQSYWALSQTLPEGARIEANDLVRVSAKIDHRINGYLLSTENLNGIYTNRRIRAGEILRSDSITRENNLGDKKSLSLLIRAADIPGSANPGDLVSIYQVNESRNGEVATPPALVIRGVFLEEISRKSANFGGDVSITISLNSDDVLQVLSATASGRIVVVPTYG